MISRATVAGCCALVVMSNAGDAVAQGDVFGACRTDVPTLAATKFDSAQHQAWYRRFWNGDCGGLWMSGCAPGAKWTDVVARLADQATPAERASVISQACSLGRLVGYEWARANSVRRISSADLQRLNAVLQGAGDPLARIVEVRARATALIAR
jgi:hypothetical protein